MRTTLHAITLSLALACGYFAGNYTDFRDSPRHRATDSSRKPAVEADTQLSHVNGIDLGVVMRGSKAWHAFWLANQNPAQQLEISRVETTCDCLSVKLTSQVIEANKRGLVRVALDTTKEPDFTGHLDVEIRFYDPNNNLIDQKTVSVEVSNPAEWQQ
jgi:Protein of unknown function (DUF1573)